MRFHFGYSESGEEKIETSGYLNTRIEERQNRTPESEWPSITMRSIADELGIEIPEALGEKLLALGLGKINSWSNVNTDYFFHAAHN